MPVPSFLDHVQITALSRVLKLNVNIAYLDGRGTDGQVDFVEFRNAHDPDAEPLILLYRWVRSFPKVDELLIMNCTGPGITIS